MKCNRCFNEVPDHFAHCPYCGEALGQGGEVASELSSQDNVNQVVNNVESPESEPPEDHSTDRSEDNIPNEEVIYRDDYNDNYREHLEEPSADRIRPTYYTPDYEAQAETYSPSPNYETSELPPGEYYYTESGDRYLVGKKPSVSQEQPLEQEEEQHKRPLMPRIIMTVILLLVIIVAAVIFLLPRLRSQSPFADVIRAIELDDEAQLAELLSVDEYGNPVDQDDLKPFFLLLQDPAYRETLLTDLKADKDSDIIKLKDRGDIPALRRYPIRLTIDPPPAQLSGSGFTNEVTAESKEMEIGPWLPGDYIINVRYLEVLGEKPGGQEYKVRLSYLSKYIDNDVYILDVPLKVVNVKINDEYPAADILINGEKIGRTVADVLKDGGVLGPIVKNSTITLAMKTPGGPLESEPILVSENDQELAFQFGNAFKVDHSNPDADVFLNGENIGKASDFKEFGYLIAPHDGVNEVTADGTEVEVVGAVDPPELIRPEPSPSDEDTDGKDSDSDGQGDTVGGTDQEQDEKDDSDSTAGGDRTGDVTPDQDSSSDDSRSTDDRPSPDPEPTQTTEFSPTEPTDPTPAPIDTTGFPYSEADLREAAKGYITKPIQLDVLKAVGTYIREDVKGARTLDINSYSNLTGVQLERHKDWLNELKQRNMYIDYTPHQVDIWKDCWAVSFENGELRAEVTETYHTTYQVVQNGVVVEERRVADRWIHYLRYDKENSKWLIYQNEIPAELEPPHGIEESFGF